MKRDGTHNLFRLSDVTMYPFFYIELAYAISTIVGIVLYIVHAGTEIAAQVPEGASSAWQVAASTGGIAILFGTAFITAGIGLYGLFKGGFKWRSTHMFLQFILRTYTTIGMLSIYGFWPTSWISSFLLALISSIIYLKLRQEQRTYENGN